MELFPGDIAGMRARNYQPLVARHFHARRAIDCLSRACPAISERAGVAGIVQDLEHTAVPEFCPYQVPFAWSLLQPAREQQILWMKGFDHGACRAGASEGVEKESQAILHLLVRIEHRLSFRVVDKAYWQGALQLAPPRFVQNAAVEPGP